MKRLTGYHDHVTPYSWMHSVLRLGASEEVAVQLHSLRENPGLGALWAAEADLGSLRMMVASMSPEHPTDYFGPWEFGVLRDSGTPDCLLRMALWEGARLRPELPCVLLPWVAGTYVQFPLGEDFSRCLFGGGLYEPNEVAICVALARPGTTAIDVGANRGLFTLALSRAVGSAGQVIAVEPSRREVGALVPNLENNVIPNVCVVKAAAGAYLGSVSLIEADPIHAGTGVIAANGKGTYSVPMVTLDSLSRRWTGPVSVLKLDVEGLEVDVLRGANGILREDRPAVVFEANECNQGIHGSSVRSIVDLLLDLGYDVYALDPNSGCLVDSLPNANTLVAIASDVDRLSLADRFS